jgi:hypothetical protein
VFVSTFGNPFRSAAEMVAGGTVSRPAYLDVDGLFAAVAAATAAPPRSRWSSARSLALHLTRRLWRPRSTSRPPQTREAPAVR